jgi:hypothetical protein
MSQWLTQFNENYYGRSEQAKELEQFLKKNYQGSSYIPWATMERMVYQQDPDAHFEVVVKHNEFGDGGILWTDTTDIKTIQKTSDKEIETLSQSMTHFIILELRFLGKLFQEVYPIQDNKYSAPKVIDQNMVNKAIQRAKAKISSRATGLGFTLYETGDLQFEEDNIPLAIAVPATVVKPATVVETPPKEAPKQVQVSQTPELTAFIGELRDNPDYDIGLQKINNAIIKKYGFSLSREDADLENKLGKIDNLSVFIRTLKVQSGIPV